MILKNAVAASWPLIATPVAIGLFCGFVGDDKSPFILSFLGTVFSSLYFAIALSRRFKITGAKSVYLWLAVLLVVVPMGAAQWWLSFELMLRMAN
jgi:hypothetical protein